MTQVGPVRTLARPGGDVAYEVHGGAGPLVVCVPSMGDLRAEYRFLLPPLTAAGYRVAMMDLRGLGGSSPRFPDYSAVAVGSDILALVQELGENRPAYLIGTSMAAAAGLWAAAESPSSVAGLVLIGPSVRDAPISAGVNLLLRVALLPPWGVRAWIGYYRKLYPKSTPKDFDEYLAALRSNLSERGRLRALRRMMFESKSRVEARLAQVHSPVLVLMGTRDPDFPDPRAEAMLVSGRTNGRFLMFEGVGHYPHAEVPELVVPALLDFLRTGGTDAPAPSSV